MIAAPTRPAPSLTRALLVTGLLAGGLSPLLVAVVGALPTIEARWAVAVLSFAYLGLASALVGALRVAAGTAPWPRRLGREALIVAALVAVTGAGVVLACLIAMPLLASSAVAAMLGGVGAGVSAGTVLLAAVILAAFASVGGLVGATVGRLIRWGWSVWERLRRTRLLWALTHAQLLVGLMVAGAIVVALASAGFRGADVSALVPDAAGSAALPARALLVLLPAVTALLLLGVIAVVGVLIPIVLISYLVLRGPTRRLEDLARVAGRLRAGDLTARTLVAGEDEVARLQADVNAMAAAQERAVGDLRTERDTVAQLLADRRVLIAAVSHELRTPVATLRSYLETALARWSDVPADRRADLEIMARETARMQRLIDELFTLSRAETGSLSLALQPTDVAALLHRRATATAALAWERGRVAVVAETPPDLPAALADPDRLEQVLGNLVSNALRHTPPGGLVRLTAASDAASIVIQVQDTGAGIAADDLPHIFERFYRADTARDQDREGTGLGLALVKELVTAMGGQVGVESTLGEGSTFTLWLPAA